LGDYETLDVYQRAFAVQRPVHQLVLGFPDYEKYDLGNQMRRACKSIPALIAEGYARKRSPKELCSFLAQAIGSANEMEVHFKTAHVLGYISADELDHFLAEYQTIGKQLTNLMKFWRRAPAHTQT
jgi:four helix bundle protein